MRIRGGDDLRREISGDLAHEPRINTVLNVSGKGAKTTEGSYRSSIGEKLPVRKGVSYDDESSSVEKFLPPWVLNSHARATTQCVAI
jgi:hypothetical protein